MSPHLRLLWAADWLALIASYCLPILAFAVIFFPLTAGSKLSLEMIAEATILLVLGWFSWFAAGKFYHVKYDPPKSRT